MKRWIKGGRRLKIPNWWVQSFNRRTIIPVGKVSDISRVLHAGDSRTLSETTQLKIKAIRSNWAGRVASFTPDRKYNGECRVDRKREISRYKPFTYTCLDYMSPLFMKQTELYRKVWVCLLVWKYAAAPTGNSVQLGNYLLALWRFSSLEIHLKRMETFSNYISQRCTIQISCEENMNWE